MPSSPVFPPGYSQNSSFGSGINQWLNVSGAGASTSGAGATRHVPGPSASMNFLQQDSSGCSPAIPAGSTIRGIVISMFTGLDAPTTTGATVTVKIIKNNVQVATRSVAVNDNDVAGPWGSSTDMWGLGSVPSDYFNSGIAFGCFVDMPNIPSGADVAAWDYFMTVYYDDPVAVPTTISASGGSNQSANINTAYPIALYAQVVDQGGLGIPGLTVMFTLPSTGPSAKFPGNALTATGVTNSSGIAQSPVFTANGTAGAWNPLCSFGSLTPGTYYETNVTPPPTPVATVILIQGNNQGATISRAFAVNLSAQIFDQFGAPLPGAQVQWTPPASGAAVSGSFTGYPGQAVAYAVTNASGIATAPVLTANTHAGNWSLPVAVTGVPAVSNTYTLTNFQDTTPPAPTTQDAISGNGQVTTINAAFAAPLVIQINDQFGTPFPGAAVSFSTPGAAVAYFAGGSTTFNGTTNASGQLTTPQVLAGSTPTASISITCACTGTTSSVFTLRSVDPTVPTALQQVSGSGQKAPISNSFALPLKARLINGVGGPVGGVNVTFTAPGAGASCTFAGSAAQTVPTDGSGIATSAIPVANATGGTYQINTTSGAFSVGFTLTNGVNYLPEVCTVMEIAPSGAINSTVGQVGASPVAWLNPQNVGATGGGATYAANGQQPPNTNRSQALLFTPPPNTWISGVGAPIKDDAKITSIQFRAWGYGNTNSVGPTGIGNINLAFVKNGVVNSAYPFAQYSGWGQDAWAQMAVKTFTVPATGGNALTGADLKLPNTGFALQNVPNSGVSGGGFRINGATMLVCYQNVDKPPDAPGPLLFCDT